MQSLLESLLSCTILLYSVQWCVFNCNLVSCPAECRIGIQPDAFMVCKNEWSPIHYSPPRPGDNAVCPKSPYLELGRWRGLRIGVRGVPTEVSVSQSSDYSRWYYLAAGNAPLAGGVRGWSTLGRLRNYQSEHCNALAWQRSAGELWS